MKFSPITTNQAQLKTTQATTLTLHTSLKVYVSKPDLISAKTLTFSSFISPLPTKTSFPVKLPAKTFYIVSDYSADILICNQKLHKENEKESESSTLKKINYTMSSYFPLRPDQFPSVQRNVYFVRIFHSCEYSLIIKLYINEYF